MYFENKKINPSRTNQILYKPTGIQPNFNKRQNQNNQQNRYPQTD